MSEERRQTRLLPFRLRRAHEERRATEAGLEGSAEDAELRRLLNAWEAPAEGAGSRERLLAAYRERVARPPLWSRLLTSSVRVPLPVAACAALAFALAAYALVARGMQAEPAAAATTNTPPPVVKIVEVPVVQERVVERVVYVEKKERPAARPAKSQLASAPRPSARDGSDASYVTPVDMAVFQPAGDINFRVIRKGRTDDE